MSIGLSNKDILTWCDDLHTLKGSVSQFQSSLNNIITKAPSSVDYELLEKELALNHSSNSPIVEKTKSLLYTPQAKVGVKIKDLYNSDLLPFLALTNKVNFKSPKSDKWVGYLNDYNPPNGIGREFFKLIKGKKAAGTTSANAAAYPPSLPPIEKSSLLTKVLTDKSFRQPSDFIESASLDDFSNRHNAKLAIRGKKLLEFALVEILDEKFPKLHEDDLYLLQYKLISPTILTKFALGYNLVEELRYSISMDGVSVKDKLYILSNIFLAYIGGISKQSATASTSPEFAYPFDEIKLWIKKLYEPIIEDLYNNIKASGESIKPLDSLARTELDFLFGDDIKYQEKQDSDLVPSDSVFIVEVKYKGEVLGFGTSGKNVEEAKLKAAQEVFSTYKQKLDEILVQEEKSKKRKKGTNVAVTASNNGNATSAVAQSGNEDEDVDEDAYEPSVEPEEMVVDETSGTGNVAVTNVPPKGPQAKNHPGTPAFYGAPPPPPGREVDILQANLPSMKHLAKKNLHGILGRHGLVPIYKYSKNNKEHIVTIMVDDVILAKAVATSKKIASQNAAQIAIANKETLAALFTKANTDGNKPLGSNGQHGGGDGSHGGKVAATSIPEPQRFGLPNLPQIPHKKDV